MSPGVLVLTGRVSGEEETSRHFAQTGSAVRARLSAAMKESAAELKGAFRGGAAHFRNKTGRLLRAIYGISKEKDDVFTVSAGVSRRAYYGRFLESGVPRRTVEVRGYVRAGSKVRGQRVNEATGKTRRGIVAQNVGFVGGYKRVIFVPAHPFATPAYEALRGRIEARILAAVKRGADS